METKTDMAKEKERLGLDSQSLVFLSTANLASYWWCDYQAVLKSQDHEEDFYASYAADIERYSKVLGKPLTWSSEEREVMLSKQEPISTKGFEDTLLMMQLANAEGRLSPMERGRMRQLMDGEQYPSLRWSFRWHDYVLVGIPDGITEDFVYEFKSVSGDYMIRYAGGPARTQADLYGMVFDRPKKRVQFYIEDEERVKTLEDPVDKDEAIKTLSSFEAIDKGRQLPRLTTVTWKCKHCDYVKYCSKGGKK